MRSFLPKERPTLREGKHGSDGAAGRRSDSSRLDRSANLLDRVVFFCLLGLMVLTVIPYGVVDAWWEAVFECAVFVITAIWIFEVLLRGDWQVRRLVILAPLILITAFAFAQTIQWPVAWLATGSEGIARHTLSIDQYQTYLTARKALTLTLFLGLLLLHTSTPRRLHWLVRVIMGLGLASALFGILRQFLQSPDSPTGFVLPFLFGGFGYGQFLSPNVFAYLMEMVFALLAGLVLGGGVRRDHVPIYLAIALIVWTALVLSNSRGGILGLTCQTIFLLFVSLNWYSTRRLSRGDGEQNKLLIFVRTSWLVRVLFMVLIVAMLIAGVLWMGGETLGLKLAARTGTSNQTSPDGTSRNEIWRSSWEIIKHHPLTGVGFGTYFLAVPEYQIGTGMPRVEEAHNDYLDLAANGGIVAIGLAGWFIAMIIWRAKSSLRSSDAYRRAAGLGAAAGMLSIGVHSLVDFGLQVTGIGVVFAALVVIAVADGWVESASESGRVNKSVSLK
jgi:O-antigen ligase